MASRRAFCQNRIYLRCIEVSFSSKEVKIYAHVSPEDKLRIMQALRKNGNVTAMTGDSVNAGNPDFMDQPSNRYWAGFGRGDRSGGSGCDEATAPLMALVTLGVMDLYLPNGLIAPSAAGDIALAQTMAFTTLVFCQLINVFNARSEYTSAFSHMFTNRWLWFAVFLGIVLQIAVVYLPILNRAFGATPLSLTDWGVAIGLASIICMG